MTCAEVEKLLLEDPEATGRTELEVHLGCCRSCEELRRQLVEIEQLNRDLSRLSGAPLGFTGKIVSEISRRRQWPALGPLAAVLVGLTLLGGGLHWSQNLSEAAAVAAGSSQPRPLQDRFPGDPPNGFRSLRVDRVADRSGSSYREVVISDPSGRSFIVRVPSTIEIRRNNLTDSLVKVSH